MSLVISSVTSRGVPIRCAARVSSFSGAVPVKTSPIFLHDLRQMPKICCTNYTSTSRSESGLLMIQNSLFAFLGSAASFTGAIYVYSELVEDKAVKCSQIAEQQYPSSWQEILKLDPFTYFGVSMLLKPDLAIKDHISRMIPSNDRLQYEPTSSISDGMMEVVEAGVNKASAWEKKAKAVVEKLTKPSRYDISVRAIKGGRLSMEDTYCIHDQGRFVGVFDGHGGSGVSSYLSSSLYDKVQRHLEAISSSPSCPSVKDVVKSMSLALTEIDDEVLEKDDLQYQGSTAVTVYVHENPVNAERTIVAANVGDSRAVLSRGSVAVSLTRDHKPDDIDERKRILAMGETIEWDSYCNVSRVRNLSLSRAIGDRFAKPVVCSEPEMKVFPLSQLPVQKGFEKNDFIVLASDGLWDVMTSQSCVDFVLDRLRPSDQQSNHMSPAELNRQESIRRKKMSRDLANEAIRRGSCDNVCVVVIWLNEQ